MWDGWVMLKGKQTEKRTDVGKRQFPFSGGVNEAIVGGQKY